MVAKEKVQEIPDWLKKLQDNLWNLEILISGGAIFSLFRFSDLFVEFIGTVRMTAHTPGAGPLLMIGLFGIKVLTLGFILHLLLRAYGLALVCINYVYPNGINTGKIHLRKPFKLNEKQGSNLMEQIKEVNRICGRVIYMAIISTIAIAGIALAFMFLIGVMTVLEEYGTVSLENLFIFIFSMFLLYILDFICFGLLRKIPYLSYILFPFFKLYDLLTLRKLYQKSLWLFSSNIIKWKFVFGAIVFAMASVCLAYLSIFRVQHWPNIFDQREFREQMTEQSSIRTGETGAFMYESSYMDNWDENSSDRFGIDSKVQRNNLMEIFVRYDKFMDPLIHQSSKIDSCKTLDKVVEVTIDDSLILGLQWVPTRKLNKSIIGISTMVPIHHLKNGQHKLQIYSTKQNEKKDLEHDYGVSLVFWVDR